MATNAQAVSILKPDVNSACYRAPLGTELPTVIGEELNELFKGGGYFHSDGIEKSDNFEEGEGIVAFGGDVVVNALSTMNPSLKFTILETANPVPLSFAYNEADITGVLNDFRQDWTDSLPDDCAMVWKFARSNSIIEWWVYPHMVFGSRDDNTNDNESPDAIPVTWNARKTLVNGKSIFGYRLVGQLVTPPVGE